MKAVHALASANPQARRWNIYAWRTIVVAAICHYFGIAGTLLSSYSFFIIPLSADFGWTRAQVSLGSTIVLLSMMVAAPVAGKVAERFGVRLVLAMGTLVMGLALCGLSRIAGDLSVFYTLYLIAALAGAGTSFPIYSRLVFSWFDQRKGLALGIVIGGSVVAATINPLLLTWIIGRSGWRTAYATFGFANLALVLPLILLSIRQPRQLRLSEPGRDKRDKSPDDLESGQSFAEAVRTIDFWKIAIFYTIVALGQGSGVHLFPIMLSKGIPKEYAALAVSAYGAASVIARLVGGPLLDLFDVRRMTAVSFALAGAGFGLVIVGGHPALVMVGAILMGAAVGAEADYMSFLVVQYFGRREYAVVHSTIFSCFLAGAAVGSYLFGWSFDAWRSYDCALWISFVTTIVAAILISTLGRRASPAAQLS